MNAMTPTRSAAGVLVEVLAVATLLHDIGVMKAFSGPLRRGLVVHLGHRARLGGWGYGKGECT